MKIALIGLEDIQSGGAYTAENSLRDQIMAAGKDHEILVLQKKDIYKGVKRLRLFRILSDFFWFFNSHPSYWIFKNRISGVFNSGFERILLKKKVDLVIFVGPSDLALRLSKIPYISTLWDLGHLDYPSLPEFSSDREFEIRDWKLRRILSKSTYVFVESKKTQERVASIFGIENSRISYLPFIVSELADFEDTIKESSALYPAHFWPHKNHKILIEALRRIIDDGQIPRKLIFTGQDRGNWHHIENLINRYALKDYVENRGFVSHSELYSLYKKVELVVMPSILGPTNFPPVESVMFGTPVAISDRANANISRLKGVLSLDPFNVNDWVYVLDSRNKMPEVDKLEVTHFFKSIEVKNTQKILFLLKEIENQLRLFKRYD